MLDTDQLRSFIAIVDTGSFRRAAEHVHKTQSAVSMHIRRLEERIGRPLFIKHGRGVKLSDDGDLLVGFAREMLRVEAAALARVGQGAVTGRVRFGIPDDYAEMFLPGIANAVSRQYPLVELSVICEGSVSLAEKVSVTRELDLAIITASGDMQGEVIREEPLVWIAAARFKLPEQGSLPLALGSATCGWRVAAESALRSVNRPFKVVLASNNFSAIEPMLSTGLAITVLPQSAVRPSMRILGHEEGMPELPSSRMMLLMQRQRREDVSALADVIRNIVARR